MAEEIINQEGTNQPQRKEIHKPTYRLATTILRSPAPLKAARSCGRERCIAEVSPPT